MNILQLFHKEVGSLIDKDIWDTDYKKIDIDEDCRNFIIRHSTRIRGGVRIRRGLIYTDKEAKERKEKLRKIKLP